MTRLTGKIGAAMASLIIATIFTNPCQAQNAKNARNKFMEGAAYIKQEKYKKALEAFENSYAIVPKANALFNIGMCQKALLRYGDAIRTFKKLLAVSGTKMDPRLKRNAHEDLFMLERLVGRLYLEGAPKGTVVIIDEHRVSTASPDEPFLLGPGTHEISVSKDGYKEFSVNVNIASDSDVVVRVSLKPKKNKLMDTIKVKEKLTSSTREHDKKPTRIFISGIVAGGMGLGGIAVGVYFARKYSDDLKKANDAADRFKMNNNPIDQNTYDDFKEKKKPADTAGMVAGFVAGGVLVVTGAILMAVGIVSKKKSDKTVSIAPTPDGMVIRF
jgi:tetratricopeptide (TPR) repeat protein